MSNEAKNGVKVRMDDLDLELVQLRYSNGRLAVAAYIVEEDDEEFGMEYGNISVNLVFAEQSTEDSIFLDDNNLGMERGAVIAQLGEFTGHTAQSGYCTYPEFVFDEKVMAEMRDYGEFLQQFE